MKIVLASNNPGKLAELHAMLVPLGITLVPQGDLGVPEAPEPFHTFLENALAKARHAAQHTGLPALADDAGLCVDAFAGQPGVNTAHYATRFGYPKGDEGNVRALLEEMEAVAQRGAALVSVLVAVRSAGDPEPLVTSGRAVGEISRSPAGAHGFGFDPVMFIPELGRTFAQLPPGEKNARSHRGQAARAMVALIRERWISATI